MDGQAIDTSMIAEQAIVLAWEKGEEVEKARLHIAHEIVAVVAA